jgi:putative FmdB family regulatory protein
VPIYEYKCSKCGEVFEAFQKITDQPLTECKHCRGRVEKLISQSSFQLKGSGWYLTDYAKKSQPAASPPDSTKTTAKPASADTKSDTKADSGSAKTD